MPRQRTAPSRRHQEKTGAAVHLRRAIWSIVIMVVAALGLLGMAGDGAGLAGEFVVGLARGLFGGLAGLWLGLLFLYGLGRLFFQPFFWSYSAVGVSFLLLGAQVYLHLQLPLNTWIPGGTPISPLADQIAAGTRGEGGGVVGGFLTYLFLRFFGHSGTYLVLAALVLVALLFIVGPAGLERWRARREEKRREGGASGPPAPGIEPSPDGGVSKEEGRSETGGTQRERGPRPPVLAQEERGDDFTVPGVYRTPPRGNSKQGRIDEASVVAVARGANQPYHLPPLSLLIPQLTKAGRVSQDQSAILEQTLANFGVKAKVVQVDRGPVLTRYEVQPAPGVKVSRIVGLADDIALALAAADVRIEAPIPGKSAVGVEVPNREPVVVRLREVLASEAFQKSPTKLALGLGVDIVGHPVVADLAMMPHLLIAGATGSGKSVCLNTMIASLLYRSLPTEVKLLLIDPKRVELTSYEGIPHLVTPVVTDPRRAAVVLKWVVEEMEERYATFAAAGTRNIEGYNALVRQKKVEAQEELPYIVVVIDELADLMLVAAVEVEDTICRLAQMARAAGIHLIIATQRPSVDIITGLIKANIPSRIAFAVTSQVDSRTILDMAGAERLLGRGDMLFFPAGAPKPLRVQGALITDQEVVSLVNFWKEQGPPAYQEVAVEASATTEEGEEDELFDEAVRLVARTGQASISLLQRRFRVGYSRAARLIDMMETRGIVGPAQGSKPREVLIRESDLERNH